MELELVMEVQSQQSIMHTNEKKHISKRKKFEKCAIYFCVKVDTEEIYSYTSKLFAKDIYTMFEGKQVI